LEESGPSSSFPARQVDEALSKYLVAVQQFGGEDILVQNLKERQKQVRFILSF
jgi:hypothetical protein